MSERHPHVHLTIYTLAVTPTIVRDLSCRSVALCENGQVFI
jgi:hypothetical protein